MHIIAEVVATLGKELHLDLPKRAIVAKTASLVHKELRAIAKKTLNLWLSKLRTKFRPKVKPSKQTQNQVSNTVVSDTEKEEIE